MRLFRRARDTKTSVLRREAVSSTAHRAPALVGLISGAGARMPSPIAPVIEAEQAVGMSSVAGESERAIVVPGIHAAPAHGGLPQIPPAAHSEELIEQSDVFVCRPGTREVEPKVRKSPAPREVTLFVHGWHQVEPGLLSWTFPSLRAALDAVQRMKNAIGWCVVSGTGWADLETARARGAVLVEQLS